MAPRLQAPRTSRLARAILLVSTIVVAAPLVDAQAALATVEGQRNEVERIVDELDRLHEQADKLAEEYAVAIDDKSQLDVEIAKAEERLAGKEAELDQLRGDLAEVAVRSFTGAGADVLGPLFSDATAYSADLRRDQYSRVALNVGTGTTDDLDELISEIEDDRNDLEDKREQAEDLAKQITEQQGQVEELLAQYKQAEADAKAKLGDLIEQEEQRRSAEALARIQAEAAQNQSSGGGSQSNGGSDGGQATGGGDSGQSGGGDNGQSGGGDSGSSGGGSSGGGGGGGGVSNVPVSGLAGVAINAALAEQGKPYRYATAGPDTYDCSGLTHYAWAQAGVSLPRNSAMQAASIPHVSPADAQPGDLIFYYSPISHVGIYIGGGQYVHAPATGDVVKVSSVNWNKVTAVGRPG